MMGNKKSGRSWWRKIIDAIDAIRSGEAKNELVSYIEHGRAKTEINDIEADGFALAQLISSLEYGDDSARKDAALSIANTAQTNPEIVREAIPKLISLLEDENGHTRGHAARALGLLGAEEALEPLKQLLNDFYTESDIIALPKMSFSTASTAAIVRRLYVRDVAQEAIEMIEKSKDIGR